ncbi:MAG: glutathione peroxidase [Saprospiraceae bacterium]|nr:glutathione peroxidase [Saprospiraceae bacterium]
MFKKLGSLLWAAILFPACFHSGSKFRPQGLPKHNMGFHTLTFETIEGEQLTFEQFKGKKVVVVNTASSCGYTDQYADLQAFYAKYGEKVMVIGFPSNQFLWQERGGNEEIVTFCKLNFGVSFPLFTKSEVKGSHKNPVYEWLTDKKKNGWNNQEPSWNFCKYVIDEDGTLLAFFPSKILPTDAEFLRVMDLKP